MRAISLKTDTIQNYFNLIKPRETLLLAFIGVCAGIIASNAVLFEGRFIMLVAALLTGSAGCNGITNYLDRRIDGLMNRTRNRVLPRGLIYPAENALFLVIPLILTGLVLAWIINPLCFVVGIVGVLASTLWRKTVTCTIFGIIAGCCPVLIGWLAFSNLNIEIMLICMLVTFWIPIHVWSVMVAKKDEYKCAGLNYFPLNMNTRITIMTIFALTVILYAIALLLFFADGFGSIYLIVANILSIIMIGSAANLVWRQNSRIAWRVYKLSSFPFLGIIFIVMVVDTIVRAG